MNIDFHFHTCISKSVPFHKENFLQAIHSARCAHLDALMMTDHFDNHDYQDILITLQENYPASSEHFFDIEGVHLYPGMEVETREGSHILLNGTLSAVQTFYQRIKPHTTEANYLAAADILALAHDFDLLCIYAHPFRPKREISNIPTHLISAFDALDINGKDLWRFGTQHLHTVTDFATQHHLPAVGGSDAHHYLQVGVISNKLSAPCISIADIKQCIRANKYSVYLHPDLSQHVESAQSAKKAWKRQYLQQNPELSDEE